MSSVTVVPFLGCSAIQTTILQNGKQVDPRTQEGRPMTKVVEAASWQGRNFSGGWTAGGGEAIEVLDKATDEVLAVVGSAAPEDVRHAGERATGDQRAVARAAGKE